MVRRHPSLFLVLLLNLRCLRCPDYLSIRYVLSLFLVFFLEFQLLFLKLFVNDLLPLKLLRFRDVFRIQHELLRQMAQDHASKDEQAILSLKVYELAQVKAYRLKVLSILVRRSFHLLVYFCSECAKKYLIYFLPNICRMDHQKLQQ